ncbi:ParA family protein [Streptosporangium sp. G11]|uniref:ParA family protein n=1 Tax=Streptosporangium sp. G11 TaxID=3436926 RepID=UPI003EBBA601
MTTRRARRVAMANQKGGVGKTTFTSGHASRTSLEIHSKIALGPAQETYDGVIDRFPV